MRTGWLVTIPIGLGALATDESNLFLTIMNRAVGMPLIVLVLTHNRNIVFPALGIMCCSVWSGLLAIT